MVASSLWEPWHRHQQSLSYNSNSFTCNCNLARKAPGAEHARRSGIAAGVARCLSFQAVMPFCTDTCLSHRFLPAGRPWQIACKLRYDVPEMYEEMSNTPCIACHRTVAVLHFGKDMAHLKKENPQGTADANCGLTADAETIGDSETTIPKLLGRLRKLFAPIQKLSVYRFKKLCRFTRYDSETVSHPTHLAT